MSIGCPRKNCAKKSAHIAIYSAFDVNSSNCDMKHINVTNYVFAFECRIFQPIEMLQSGDIAIALREVKIPIVPLFAGWDKIQSCVVDKHLFSRTAADN